MAKPASFTLRLGKLLLASLVVLAGCAAPPPEPVLFDRLGGLPAIKAVVDKTIDRAAVDPQTSRSFKGIRTQGVKESVVAQICEATGGPCKYEGATMAKAHKGLDISDAEFKAFVGHLVVTMDEFKVPAREKSEVLHMLAPMKADIVTR